MQKLKFCETCARPFPPDVQVGGVKRQALYDFIAKHPEGVGNRQVMEYVWADDPEGGPLYCNIISVMIHTINKKLASQGHNIRIRGSGGAGSTYRVVYL